MIATSHTDRTTPTHCYGAYIRHLGRQWIVQFPDVDAGPTAVFELTGVLTPDLLRHRCAPMVKEALGEETTAGEWSLLPCADGRYDIGAHLWNCETSELEARLSRVAIDLHTHVLPAGFTSVLAAVPEADKPVIAVRRSGYLCATFEVMTARYMPDYRPKSPWRDVSGDAVGDSGEAIMGWRDAREWLLPT